jgi:hypothetical protein
MRIAVLARPAVARLLRSRRGWLTMGAWCVLGVALAVAARVRGAPHGADQVLIGAFGSIVLPLLGYATVGAVLGMRSLAASGAPLVAFGAVPSGVAAASLVVAVGAGALLSAGTALCVALLAHGAGDPPVVHDAVASAYAGALGGAAYAAWFSLGASFGRRGGGRAGALVVDWLLDGLGGSAALLSPRAHVRNLLGGAAPAGLPERASAVVLVVLAIAYALAAVLRVRRQRVLA